MFAPILAALLISGPPARSPNTETALRIANELAGNLKVSGYDLEVSVRNRRNVSISGRIDSIDDLKAVLDTVTPHADTLTLRIGVGCEAPAAPGSADFSRRWHADPDWSDDRWQQTLIVRPEVTGSSK
jgi:hypothetical protein